MNRTEPAGPKSHKNLVSEASLRQRFTNLWLCCRATNSVSDTATVWKRLWAGYTESHRRYHTEHHLAHCLEQLDLLVEEVAPQPDRIEMAIWFHDVIYEPGRPDNEALSADLFSNFANKVMHPRFVAAVVDLILATTHSASSQDPVAQIVCDIDLASFGFPWRLFLEDSANLRAEFQGSIDGYSLGRRRFLEALLQRPRIYMTDFFNNRYEHRARDNIRCFLASVDE